MSKTIEVDVAIIGAGSAGLSAHRAVKRQHMSALMIDPGPHGTTCARTGCMPSKLLIAAAEAAHDMHRASRFGVRAGHIEIDGQAVMKRVQDERDRFVGFVEETIDEAIEQGELIEGRALIAGERELDVTMRDGSKVRVEFDRLVLAVGSRPFIPSPFRVLSSPVLITSEEIFEFDDLPESMLVIGLGVIGLELGQAMHRLGVRTTLLGMGGGLGPLHDAELLDEAKRIFKAELDIHPDYDFKGIEMLPDGAGVRIEFVDSEGRERSETYERVLMAAGRRSNLDRVGLEHIDVHPDDSGGWGIHQGTLQLRELPIYVAGDANGLHPLLHEATDDGKIAGRNAARHPEPLAPRRRVKLSIMFTDPQIAIIGHHDARFHGKDLAVGKIDYGRQGRARVMGVNRGLFKVYGNDDGLLLGGEFLGPRAEHMSHLLAWAIQSGLTVDKALSMPFYHPVFEEGFRTALCHLSSEIKHRAKLEDRVAELGVGS